MNRETAIPPTLRRERWALGLLMFLLGGGTAKAVADTGVADALAVLGHRAPPSAHTMRPTPTNSCSRPSIASRRSVDADERLVPLVRSARSYWSVWSARALPARGLPAPSKA